MFEVSACRSALVAGFLVRRSTNASAMGSARIRTTAVKRAGLKRTRKLALGGGGALKGSTQTSLAGGAGLDGLTTALERLGLA